MTRIFRFDKFDRPNIILYYILILLILYKRVFYIYTDYIAYMCMSVR